MLCTIETLHEMLTLRETLNRTAKFIQIESALDDGGWRNDVFANEAAAVEFETKCRKRGIDTRRV